MQHPLQLCNAVMHVPAVYDITSCRVAQAPAFFPNLSSVEPQQLTETYQQARCLRTGPTQMLLGQLAQKAARDDRCPILAPRQTTQAHTLRSLRTPSSQKYCCPV